MTTTTCLPRETLERYLSGAIAEDETGDIEAHLSICAACEQTVWQLEADPDTLLESMRELAAIESQEKSVTADSPSVIQRAIAAARVLPSPPTLLPAPLGKPAQIGAYELLQSLGRGGMGQVFLARHTSLDKQVAVKLLFPRPGHAGLDTENLISRFQREMRAAGRLNHPTIVSATDAGQENGTHYLVMEYIDGLDLSRLAKATGPLEIADACELMRTVAQGLSHAHAEGIVHRDVKPSNLMLDRQGRVKILDFGLAQWNLLNESANKLTTVGQLMGTLDYMAPEQAERNDGVDYRADLYALGATLFRLLTGRPPLAASPHMTLLEKVRLLGSQSAPSLSSLRCDAPAALVKLVASLLNRQINERPASAAHVAEALEPFCIGHDLASLFARAETIIDQEVTSHPENLASERSSHSPVAEPIAQLPPPPPSRRFPWLWAAAAVPMMILAGVVISLETQKGQLVIQSDVADIHVKLRRDNQTVKELTVQPGATTTRLYADQYEIVIDAPSDQVSLDKENLVVRSGQTIVANIKQLPSSQPTLQNSNVESTPPGLKAPTAKVVASSENDTPALSLPTLGDYAQRANSDEVQTSIAQHKVENTQLATKAEKPEPPPTVAKSSTGSNVDDWLTMLAKAATNQDREKCLNSLLDTLDETYGPTATPKLLASARTWDYEQAASANLLEQLRGRTPPAFSRPSPETLLLTCLSRCNTAYRFLEVLCNELLTGEDAWTARWMAGLVQYTQEGTYRGLHSDELLERMLSTQFATERLREFGPDTALLWQEYLRRELSSNRRWAQVYSQLAVKRIVEQRHLGPMSLLQMDPSRDLSPSGAPNGKLVLEEAIASYAKLVLVDRKSAPGYYAHAAFRLATTGPFVERWREELKPVLRQALQVLIKQDDATLFGRLSDPPQRNLEWTSYEIPASVDAFLPPDNLPSPLRGLRYVNSETLGYLALIKRLELASEFDAELKALLERAIAGRQPLEAIAKQKREWIVKQTWSGNRSALPAPWNDAPELAWNANFVYNAISALLSDIINADSAAQDLLVRHQTQMNMDRADTNEDGRLSATEIETISGSRLPVDINQDGSWDFEELLADQLKSWKRYSRVPD